MTKTKLINARRKLTRKMSNGTASDVEAMELRAINTELQLILSQSNSKQLRAWWMKEQDLCARYRRALLEANRRRHAEHDRPEARERRLTALGFEPPGQDAYTCGDAIGLRRLDEVDKDPPDPAKTSPV